METSRQWEVLWATIRGLLYLGRHSVLIPPVVRLARFRKKPQEAYQFSGSACRQDGSASVEKRSLPVEPSGLLCQGLVAHSQESGKWAIGRGYTRQVDCLYRSTDCVVGWVSECPSYWRMNSAY